MNERIGDIAFRIRLARHTMPDRFQERAARWMPRWVVYRCTMLAYSRAWHETNKTPEALTFEDVVKPWEDGR